MSVEGSDRRDVHILVGLLVNWFEADNTIAQPPNSMVRGHTSQRAPPADTAIEEDNKINAVDLVTRKGTELMVIWLKESIKSILDSQTHHSEDRVHKKAPNSSKSTVFADFGLICLFCHKNIILDDVQIRRKSCRHWLK